MSRITKWKLEKNKVKVVFRLQFNATHVRLNSFYFKLVIPDGQMYLSIECDDCFSRWEAICFYTWLLNAC